MNANGRDSTRTAAYTYDQVNRLATAQTPSAATWGDSYVYDAWGNLLQKNVIKGTAESMALTVNNKNQVTTPAFTYDAAGNVTSDTSVSMAYDAEGRMNPTSGTTYTYDGDGRRVKKSDGTVYWEDDSFRPLSVGTTSGSITRDYIFLGGKRIAFVPLSSGNPYYYLSDHLGSTAVIASGDGKTIQWEADYFPFGAVRQVFKNIASNNYEFTGYEFDSDTGYNYAVARYEAGRWGRFLSPDPYLGSMDITNPQSMNRYSYVQNNAINAIDPWGLVMINPTAPTPGIGSSGGGLDDLDIITCVAFEVGCRNLGDGSSTVSTGGGGTPSNNLNCSVSPASGGVKQWVTAFADAAGMTAQFFTGLGGNDLLFTPDTVESQKMASSPGVTGAVNSYLKTGQASGLYSFGLGGLAHAGINPTQQFVGSYRWTITPATGGLNLSLTNTTSFKSLTYDRGPQWQRGSNTTPMGNTHQTYNIFIPCK